MTLKTCFRCDWQGETSELGCPNCRTRPLYVVGASARTVEGGSARARPDEGSREAPSASIESTGRSNRATLAIVSVALVLAVSVGAWLYPEGERSAPPASIDAAPRSTPSGDGPPSLPPPTPATAIIGSPSRADIGRQSTSVKGVPLSFVVPSSGWWRWGDLFVTKSTVGPQGADAIVLWTDVSRSRYAHACGQWWGSPVGSLADWARQASKARGTELVSGPAAVTVDGYPAQHVVFTIRRDVACNPGFFHTWEAADDGAFWSSTEVGDTIRIWLVKVGGKVIYIEGDTHANASTDLKAEVERIVASVMFD